MIPFRTPFLLPLLYPSLVWRIPTEQKELFLTFDDGPVSGPTEFALEVLEKKHCRATFFCIGDNIRKYPSVFQQIRDKHHVIGNHTYNHLNGWSTNLLNYIDNISKCELEIQKNGTAHLKKTTCFRPPYGRITRKQIAALPLYKIIMWDVLTHDYNKSLSPESCLRKSINATRNGSIIVFHDSHKAEKNMMEVLPRFIDHFSEKGYQFKSLVL
jgi:peptidoglycan/xylan/chitin deacetylase (PgdA/CDA1 family)